MIRYCNLEMGSDHQILTFEQITTKAPNELKKAALAGKSLKTVQYRLWIHGYG